ncbi:MAG: hydrophobic protein [Actinomycetota bacterium]
MVFLLVLALVLFMLGLFTAKILWWAALIIAVVWLVGMIRPSSRIFH